MPKVKTNKSIVKRFKITKTGKVLRGQSFTSHLKVRKSAKHKMRLSGTIATKDSFAKRIIKATGVRIRKRRPVVNKEA
jgi:large subunit ribosomal protein L35